MKAYFNESSNTITLGEGIQLLESHYDDIRKPVFIDVVNNLSSKIGTYKKQGDIYFPTNDYCQNPSVLATLNLNINLRKIAENITSKTALNTFDDDKFEEYDTTTDSYNGFFLIKTESGRKCYAYYDNGDWIVAYFQEKITHFYKK